MGQEKLIFVKKGQNRFIYTLQIKKQRSLLNSNLGAPINFRKTSFFHPSNFSFAFPHRGKVNKS